MSDSKRLTTKCPCCEAVLVLDGATGEVISYRRPRTPPAGGKDLDSLFEEMERGRAEAEDLFEKERSAMKDRERLLEEKFQEALKRAEEEPDEEPPPRPFDLD